MKTNYYYKIWKQGISMGLSQELAYKWNFIIKCIALILVDMIGPVVAALIYSTSSGIPGWAFNEFILFTGTFTFVFGIAHATMFGIPWFTIEAVRRGEFDKYLVKPVPPLLYLTFTTWDLDGFAEILAGAGMILWSLITISVNPINFIWYLLLIIAGSFFMYAIMVLIAATSFLIVKSMALFDIFFDISKFARYPLNVFGITTRTIFTFIFPIAIAAHYPTTVLLSGISFMTIIEIIIPVAVFFVICMLLWKLAMRRYTSAGG